MSVIGKFMVSADWLITWRDLVLFQQLMMGLTLRGGEVLIDILNPVWSNLLKEFFFDFDFWQSWWIQWNRVFHLFILGREYLHIRKTFWDWCHYKVITSLKTDGWYYSWSYWTCFDNVLWPWWCGFEYFQSFFSGYLLMGLWQWDGFVALLQCRGHTLPTKSIHQH